MSLLFMNGFGDNSAAWWSSGDTYSVSNSSPRYTGGYYLVGTGSVEYYYKSFAASPQIFVGFGLRPYMSTSVESAVGFFGDSGNSIHIVVARNALSGLLQIRRGDFYNATLLATGSTPIPANSWSYIEMSMTISDTIGQVHVRLNGSTTDEVSFTGDTKNGGTSTNIDTIGFRILTDSPSKGNISDLYICNSTGAANNTFLGDVAVRPLFVSGNGTYSQLTGSDGNQTDNYALVDEIPFSDTDYVSGSTAGLRDTYNISDVPTGLTNVYAVQISDSMSKNDAGAATAKNAVLTHGSLYYGATRYLSNSPVVYNDVFEVNPFTSAAWTIDEVNSLEAGMEVT